MKLYYTGAVAPSQAQTNPLQSLGGYIATSPVANGGLSTLFGAISQKSLKNGLKEQRCVALKNETQQKQIVTLYYNNVSKEPVSSFKMALVAPALDECGNAYVEKIQSVFSKPVTGTFLDNKTKANAFVFEIEVDSYIGIWIERSVNRGQGQKVLSCDNMVEKFVTESKAHEAVISVNATPTAGQYFLIDTTESSLVVWFDDVDTNSIPPSIDNREPIRVLFNSTDTLAQIATKLQNSLELLIDSRGEATTKVTDSTVTFTQTQVGAVKEPSVGTSPISITQTQGFSSENELVESLEITIDYENIP